MQSILTEDTPLCLRFAVLFESFVQRTMLIPLFSREIRPNDKVSIGRISRENRVKELSEISRKIAIGEAKKADVEKAKALQVSLQIPFATDQVTERGESLRRLEEKLNEFEELKREIGQYLDERERRAKKKR